MERSQGLPVKNLLDLWFDDSHHGWITTQTTFDDEPYLFTTADGGKTWKPESDRLFRGIHHLGTVVRFVSREMGFVFEDEVTYTHSEHKAASNTLRYTTDGGAHWNNLAIYYAVQDCQVFEGNLLCAATPKNGHGYGVLTLRLTK